MGLSGGLADSGGLSSSLANASSGLLAARPAAATAGANYLYFATDDSGGTVYRSDGSSWTKVAAAVNDAGSGQTLGSATITSNFTITTVSPSYTDVTGLSVTVTVGTRPIEVIAWAGRVFNSGAFRNDLLIVEGSTILQNAQQLVGGANQGSPFYLTTGPITPSAGSHTYKVQGGVSAASTMTIQAGLAAGNLGPAGIMVRQL